MADPKVLAVARGTLTEDVTVRQRAGDDLHVVVVPAVRVVLVRVVRTYLQTLIGLLTALGLGVLPVGPVDQLAVWQQVLVTAGLALFPAFMSLLQNVWELLGKWDVTKPELRG